MSESTPTDPSGGPPRDGAVQAGGSSGAVESPSAERAPARPLRGASPDEAIPMLTEIVDVPRYVAEELPETLAEVDWGGLAERVRENVTERLSRRSQLMLDELLRDSLQAAVDRAADALAAELRDSLSQMVRDIVARAVTEEITRVHAEISQRGGPGGSGSQRA
jgi:hypothetical protein